jgi:hypothetical protein
MDMYLIPPFDCGRRAGGEFEDHEADRGVQLAAEREWRELVELLRIALADAGECPKAFGISSTVAVQADDGRYDVRFTIVFAKPTPKAAAGKSSRKKPAEKR